MSEWWRELPWGKIAAGALTAIAAAIGGAVHLEADRGLDAGQRVQTDHVLRHWGEECQVVADSLDHSVQVRFCSSDGCYHFRVSRPGSAL